MRWEDIPATSVAKYLNTPVRFNITDIYTEEPTDVHHVERFLVDDGTWKDTLTKANTGAPLTDFPQVQ